MSDSLKMITACVEWYKKRKDWQPSDLDDLLNNSRRLACEIYTFSGEVGDAHADMSSSEYNRKSQFAEVCNQLTREDEKKGNKPIMSQIEREANFKINEHLRVEKLTESIYKKMYLQLEAAKGVQDQIRQQISYFKTEKVQEMNGTGSQQ